jgi:hypothetical protein
MKKFLLTASMLVMGVVATFAQNWAVGDEITGKIINPSFMEADVTPWHFDYQGGNPTTTGGVCELYSGANADLYQYIELPAGMYKLECQGYYRIGTGWDVDPKTYGTEQWEDNAVIYVQNGKYDIESETFTAGRTFKTPLMPRLFEYSESKIYDMNEAGDPDPGWDMSDNDCTAQGWGWAPASIAGSLKWFSQGKYLPVDDGDNKYNTVTFFLTEDGYVKVGVMKTKASDADSFMATNFKLYYAGEAGEAAELMALQEEVEDLYTQLEKLRDENPGFLEGKVGDELMLFDMEYGAAADMDKDECSAAKDVLFALLENAKAAKNDLATLNIAIKAIDVLATTTDYPGIAALNQALRDAKASISSEYVYEGEEEWDTYSKLAEALYAARVDYLKSAPKTETGAWDFSPFIANRFFTNEENNPTWNAETNQWEYAQELKDAYPDFFNAMEFDGNNQVLKDARTAISGDVVLSGSDDTVPFKWYKTGSGGPGWEVYYDHTMTSCKSWAVTPTSGISVIGQYLTGLPNGFYSLTGMAEAWDNEGVDAVDNHFIIRSSTASSRSERAEPKPWWGGLGQNTWNTLSTDMVEVTDGELHVEASLNGFYSITGFQLFYYGETPDFNAMIKPSLEQAKVDAAALSFPGDKKNAEDILAKVPAKIDSKEAYLAASEVIAEANEYIKKANNAVNNWKGLDNFTNLLNQYQEGSVEKTIINVALAETMEVGEGEADTYEDAIANNEQYNAYVAYLTYRESIGEFIKEASVAPIVEEQNAYLTGNFATPEKLDEFKLAIGVEYNKAKFAAEGIDKATLTDPKSVTFLLINPSFDEGCEKGWTTVGTGAANNNEYSFDEAGKRTNAELWNREAFTFSQVVSGLPAGTYEFRVRACYRAGSGVSKQSVDEYLAAGGEEGWAKHNAVLYAKSSDNEWNSYIKAVESLKATENSFTQCGTAWEADEVSGGNYATAIHFLNGTIEDADKQEGVSYTGHDEGAYPLDSKITLVDEETLEEVTYYYPASMQGFYQACKKDAKAYANSVIFYISESGNIELGINKKEAIGGDWIIMDDFELYYLGKEAPVAIDEVADNAAAQGAVEYYSVNGVKLNAPQAGLNIVKYANGEVRKVFINK